MGKQTRLSRRGLIRLISYTAALIVALTFGTIGGYSAARRHRTTIEYGYQRALGELTEYLGNLDIALEKGKYASTATQLQGLSSKLWREAGYAKNTLDLLPVNGSELAGTYKFLSQVGDFCMVLADRVAAGGSITEEERASLKTLSDYSHDIYDKVALMQNHAEAGLLSFDEAADGAQADAPAVNSGFHDMEEGFEDYPTLIYDGPFSDHIQQQKPKALEGKAEVGAAEAMKTAAAWKGGSVTAEGETGGSLPCYQFTADDFRISVTKTGGYVQYFLNSRPLGEGRLTIGEALEKGAHALKEKEMEGFVERYYSLNNGILTINYAYSADGVVYYPDLVKVGIAMDNGEMVSFDATGYLMNHTVRTLPNAALSAEEAQAKLSPLLQAEGETRLALVPGEGLDETLCYEFACTGEEGERVLVYIDVQTGYEEQILILLQDDTGTLVM
jgi:germination protein ypeB